jgi:hypothetical protein
MMLRAAADAMMLRGRAGDAHRERAIKTFDDDIL